MATKAEIKKLAKTKFGGDEYTVESRGNGIYALNEWSGNSFRTCLSGTMEDIKRNLECLDDK